jgi:hypothetical protein
VLVMSPMKLLQNSEDLFLSAVKPVSTVVVFLLCEGQIDYMEYFTTLVDGNWAPKVDYF